MLKFRLTADCTFYADSIDDAFNLLAEHFGYLQDTENSGCTELQFEGKIEIKPLQE